MMSHSSPTHGGSVAWLLLIALSCVGCSPNCERELDELCPSDNPYSELCDSLADSIHDHFYPEAYRHFECGGLLVVETYGKDNTTQTYYDPGTRELVGVAELVHDLVVNGRCNAVTYGDVPPECPGYRGPYLCGLDFARLEQCP